MSQIEEKLDRLIELKLDRAIDNAAKTDTEAIDEIDTLCGIKNEIEKTKTLEAKEKAERVENWKDRLLNAGVTVGLAIGGWKVYDRWLRMGLSFEETGSLGSQWTRALIGKMLPKLK